VGSLIKLLCYCSPDIFSPDVDHFFEPALVRIINKYVKP
jgi:hypothetical protein